MNISNKHIPTKTLLHFVLLHFALLLCITFCVKSCYILRYRHYYILRRKLLHFALLLHFVAKVITFCVTITFCVSYYILWRNIPSKLRRSGNLKTVLSLRKRVKCFPSVHTTLEKFKNATITGHFQFVLEENSDKIS